MHFDRGILCPSTAAMETDCTVGEERRVANGIHTTIDVNDVRSMIRHLSTLVELYALILHVAIYLPVSYLWHLAISE